MHKVIVLTFATIVLTAKAIVLGNSFCFVMITGHMLICLHTHIITMGRNIVAHGQRTVKQRGGRHR